MRLFSNRSKLGWRAIWARFTFLGKTSPSGTRRVRTTARCMTLVHLYLFLSIACGHLPEIFGPVTKAIPRAKDTQSETLKYDANPTRKNQTHASHSHRTHKSQIKTDTNRTPPHLTYSLLNSSRHSQRPHARTARRGNRERNPTSTLRTFARNPTTHRRAPLKPQISTANQCRTHTHLTYSIFRTRRRVQHLHTRTERRDR